MVKNQFFLIVLCVVTGLLIHPYVSDADSGGAFLRHFKFHSTEGPVTLHSDISEEFTGDHSRHALLVWNYYKKTFSRSPGNRIILYYTKDHGLYDNILKRYPSITLKGARQVTANWTGECREWFIMPFVVPDYGTQLHEISHDFLYATYPASENFPWFKEGSGMYYESGIFNAQGKLVIERPMGSYHSLFKDWAMKKQVIPLAVLLRMPKNDYYRADYTKTYSQSMMIFFYLTNRHPETMAKVFAGINDRTISNNELLVNYIIRLTGKKLGELEREYIEYGR
jgi:hypothetical protein